MSSDLQDLIERAVSGGLAAMDRSGPGAALAWRDFARLEMLLTPELTPAPSQIETTPSEGEVEDALALASAGLDPSILLSFTEGLRAALVEGMTRALDIAWAANGGVRYDGATDTLEANNRPGVTVTPTIDGLMDARDARALAELLEMYLIVNANGNVSGNLTNPHAHPLLKQLVKRMKHHIYPGGAYFFFDDIENGVASAFEVHAFWVALVYSVRWTWFEVHFPGALDGAVRAYTPACDLPGAYDFRPIRPGTLNVGLRLVHRQEWRSFGTRAGEIVRTIPLGPKQVERVSTVVLRRSKRSRESSAGRTTQENSEFNDSTTSSNEVIEETSNSFGWGVSAEGSLDIKGVASAGIGAEANGQRTQASKATNARLSELMKRRATEVRSESKVVVTTENEVSFEAERSSELTNPNDEIALNFEYRRLLQEYEVLTRLYDVEPVVYVAETVPDPEDIDLCWVRRHDWILRNALLDPSFGPILDRIHLPNDTRHDASLSERFDTVLADTMSHVGTVAGSTQSLSLSDVDLGQEAQKVYREVVESERARFAASEQVDAERRRLLTHLRDNILHYLRAIWANEDSDQRMQRYLADGTSLHQQWTFFTASGGIPVEDLLSGSELNGFFFGTGSRQAVSDFIDPSGPVATFSNYTVHRVRESELSGSIGTLFDFLRAPFLDSEEMPGGAVFDVVRDPELQELREAFPPDVLGDEIFDDEELVEDMLEVVPGLQQVSMPADVERLKSAYPEYVYRLRNARRFMMDTNNLTLDVVASSGTALESFKLAHRAIDVVRAAEGLEEIRLENQRRSARLDAGSLSDPDIERVTVVSDAELVDLDED